jgi:hypothetical protein
VVRRFVVVVRTQVFRHDRSSLIRLLAVIAGKVVHPQRDRETHTALTGKPPISRLDRNNLLSNDS